MSGFSGSSGLSGFSELSRTASSRDRDAFVTLSIVQERCRVCRHAKRAAIEAACRADVPIADVADFHGLSERALDKHMTAHLAPLGAEEESPATSRSAQLAPPPSAKLDALLAELKTVIADVERERAAQRGGRIEVAA